MKKIVFFITSLLILNTLECKKFNVGPKGTRIVLHDTSQLTFTQPAISGWYTTTEDGDLLVPADTVYHITSDAVLDGYGKTILLNDNSQLFVDTDVTLTIRNANIIYTRAYYGFPPIKLASTGSKLALDNVKLTLNDNFNFLQGQLFVHNDVKITGTAAFIYTSPMPSWIASKSRLMFDVGTTFSVAPATFTDAPYTLINTYTNNNFIKMADKSSQLYLNGCSLKTTNTGLRLTKGTVLCDNAISFDTNATNSIARFSSTVYTTTAYGGNIYALNWSPHGKYIAAGGTVRNSLAIYKAPDTTNGWLAETNYGGTVQSIRWSPDGKYIAVAGLSINLIKIYQFDGASLHFIAQANYTGHIYSLAWSPDGRFIAAGGATTQTISIYQLDGNSLRFTAQSANYNGTIISIKWSPDGHFIAAGGGTTQAVRVYQFDGLQFTNNGEYITQATAYGGIIYSLSWNPDGRFIAAGGATDPKIKIYQFTGNRFTQGNNPIATSQSYGGSMYYDVLYWNPNGTYISAGGLTANVAKVYQFSGNGFSNNGYHIATAPSYGGAIHATAFSPDGKYIAAAGATTQAVRVYPLEFTKPTTPQALSKSIVFGDSTKGAAYDADLQILSGATIKLTGTMNYDCVS